MKIFLTACLIFALLFGGVLWNTHYIIGTLEDLRAKISAIPVPEEEAKDLMTQYQALCSIAENWQENSTGFSMSVNHADLMDAELHLTSAKAAAAAGSREDYLIYLADLDYSLGHLAEMSAPSFKNLL